MKRENRYLVLKWDDIEATLNKDDRIRLERIIRDINIYRRDIGKGKTQYVCVAHDWPMYEDTWKSIEEWVDGMQI